MLVNCLIGRRLKAPRAVPIRAGPTTGMPMVILALDMAPPAQQTAPSCSRSGSAGGAFTPALPAAYAPTHVDTRGRTGGNAVPSPANCAVSPGWSRVNLNHRPHLYRVVSAMAWGVGSSAVAPPANGSISAVTGSAGQRGQRRTSSTMITMTAMRTIVPMPIYTTGSSLPLSHRDFRRSRVGNCPGRARRDCIGSPGSRAF